MGLRHRVGVELAEPREAPFRRPHYVHELTHPNEVDGAPRIERKPTDELEGPARPPYPEPSPAVQYDDREGDDSQQGDQRFDDVSGHRRHRGEA